MNATAGPDGLMPRGDVPALGDVMPAPLVDATGLEPFRGLQFFDETHAHLFYGRDDQVDELLEKLRLSRFVAVLGSSGSGKSSLVRAGLIPALRGGISEIGGRWHMIKTRPADDPIGTLATDLSFAIGPHTPADIEVTLRRGPRGLVEAIEQTLPDGTITNVLVLVDQFEELFRFQDEAPLPRKQHTADEAAAYVKLLLEPSQKRDEDEDDDDQKPDDGNDRAEEDGQPSTIDIYVVLTMRSDFLSRCAQFPNLPERFNDGIYLVPRMGRDQLRDAMVGPVAMAEGSIEPALVQRVLNDIGDDPDQLPVLEHALLMTWRRTRGAMNLEAYGLVGAFAEALSLEANRVYDTLSERQQEIARVVFQRLSGRDAEGRDVRSRAPLRELAAIAGTSEDDTNVVVARFEAAGLLTTVGDLIDVPHESFIRKWDKFQTIAGKKGWLDQEVEARDLLRELDTRERRRVPGDVLDGTDLDQASRWAQQHPHPEWAVRYLGDGNRLVRIHQYIEDSIGARQRRNEERVLRERAEAKRRRRVLFTTIGIAIVFAVLGAYAVSLSIQRAASEDRARANEKRALDSEQRALKSEKDARASEQRALMLQEDAEKAAQRANEAAGRETKERTRAESEAKRANESLALAQQATAEANRARGAADKLAQENDAARRKAELATATENRLRLEAQNAQKKAETASQNETRLRNATAAQALATRASVVTNDRALAAQLAIHAYVLHRQSCERVAATRTCVIDPGDVAVQNALQLALNQLKPSNAIPAAAGGLNRLTIPVTADEAPKMVRPGNGAVNVIDVRGAGVVNWGITLDGRTTTVALPPGQHVFASGTLDGDISISVDRSFTTNPEAPRWPQHLQAPGAIVGLAFSRDSTLLAAVTENGFLRRFEASARAVPTTVHIDGAGIIVRMLAFAPDSRTVVVATNQGAYAWDLRGAPRLLPGTGDVRAIAFSQDGTRVVFGTNPGQIHVARWTGGGIEGLAQAVAAQPSAVTAVAIAPAKSVLVAGGVDGAVRFWSIDAARYESLGTSPTGTFNQHKGQVHGLAFADDNHLYSMGADGLLAWTIPVNVLAKELCTAFDQAKLPALNSSQAGRLLALSTLDSVNACPLLMQVDPIDSRTAETLR
jgi:WD domain, G-beta repeat